MLEELLYSSNSTQLKSLPSQMISFANNALVVKWLFVFSNIKII